MFCAKVVLYCNNRKFIAMALSSNLSRGLYLYLYINSKITLQDLI